ncbi:MAG: YiiX/YebB-like N1pC/P60 family cysteine hydrolase [Thiotrichales bacterium]
MVRNTLQAFGSQFASWMNQELDPPPQHPVDIARIKRDLRPGDVILVEGRSRISRLVKAVTLSNWTHAAIYIGRPCDYTDLTLRAALEFHHRGVPSEHLVVEALLGEGTVIRPIDHYRAHQLRVCRPRQLTPDDAQLVVTHALSQVGLAYDLRQMFDLARLLYPYAILPRRWRSTLFQARPRDERRTICSTLIAEAFAAVAYPILPRIVVDTAGRLWLQRADPRLCTPRDFDHSPYFDALKFAAVEITEAGAYRDLAWLETERPSGDDPTPVDPWFDPAAPPARVTPPSHALDSRSPNG